MISGLMVFLASGDIVCGCMVLLRVLGDETDRGPGMVSGLASKDELTLGGLVGVVLSGGEDVKSAVFLSVLAKAVVMADVSAGAGHDSMHLTSICPP